MADPRKRRLRRERATRVRTTLCKEGAYQLVIMAFLLLAALIRQINLLLLIFSGLTVPLLWNWYFVRASLKNLTFRRHAPQTCNAGDRIVIDIEAVNNRKRRNSWAVSATDSLRLMNPDESRRPMAAKPVQAAVVFARIKPGETVREAYEGRLTQRGEYRLGPLIISTRFPLGLVRRSYRIKLPQTLIVHPRLGNLTRQWRERSQRSYHGGVSVSQRQGIVEAEFHSLREYRSGDSKNWIHWRTTARRGEPIVRQFEQQRNLDMTVILDLWIPPKPTQQDLETVEIAVSFAATLISTQSKRGLGNLILATHRHEPNITRGVASHALLRESLNDLAIARCSKEDNLPKLLNLAMANTASRQGEVVVVSTRPNDLNNPARFANVASSFSKTDWLSRTVYVDCSRPDLHLLFEIPNEEPAQRAKRPQPGKKSSKKKQGSKSVAKPAAAKR